MEQWRPVLDPRFTDAYQASDMGRIRSLPRQVRGRGDSLRTIPGTVLSPRIRPDGTPAVNLWLDNDYVQFPVKRLVLEAFTRRHQPRGYDAKNIDENPLNNKLSNLRWEPVGGLALLRQSLQR